MKKTLVVVLLSVLAVTSHGTLLSIGSNELGLSGMVDFDSPGGTLIDLNMFYGYFVTDFFEVGVKTSFTDADDFTSWSFGPVVEQNFDLGVELIPFVGASLAYAQAETDSGTENAFVIGVQGGGKYFLTEYLAVSTALVLELANEDIFPAEDDFEKYDVRLELGLRTFF